MTYQGERARPMASEKGRVFEVSKVRIGADGHVSDVLWVEVDSGSDQDVGTRVLASAAEVVYEEEAALFFDDKSDQVIRDDLFERLLTFPNVLVTGHQGFFTADALKAIADTTIANINAFAKTGKAVYEVTEAT